MSEGSHLRPRSLVREYFARHRGLYTWGFLLLAATNVLALSVPRLLKYTVEALQAADRKRLILYSAAIAAVAIAQAGVRTLSRLAILGASRQVAYELRDRLFRHLQRLPLSYYASRPVGDITSRAVNDMLLVRSFFGPGLMNLVNTSLVYVTSLALMFLMDVRLTLLAIAPYPFFMLAVNRLSRRVYGRSMAVQEQLAAITSRAQENISGINLIKTYAREEAEAAGWAAQSREYFARAMSLARARGAMAPLMGIMASAGTLVVIGIGGRAVVEGRLTLGDFVAFNAYLAYLVWPTFAFGWILNTFQRGAAALKRIGEILGEPTEERDLPEGTPDRPLGGDVAFQGLTFAHPGAPSGTSHLWGIDLAIPRGGVLGILGTVGSGKSTLVSLLPRIVQPPPGTVFVDGRDVNEIPLARLRRDIGMVPQESFLFSRTIRENVAFGPGPVSEAEMEDAIAVSRLEKDLLRFPRGLDTIVGERGFTLSGGQRQRAAIARALACSPRILILDDALSSLDAEVEQEVLEGLQRYRGDRTLIIVSNRVATLSWADEIAVMDDGRIVERGRHDDLIEGDGLYARIHRRQSLAHHLEEI